MRAVIAGIGLCAPGLPDWTRGRAVLAGTEAWRCGDVAPPLPALLAPNERRRAGLPVRLALTVAEEAMRTAGLPPDAARAVFASANGESEILHGLLETLAEDEPSGGPPAISPTRFHNSVHNAVAGYWSIGVASQQPVTCLGAHDDTLGAALLKAFAEVSVERTPVLCCVYDVPAPEPLRAKVATESPFAAALVLLPQAFGGLAEMEVAWRAGAPGPTRQPYADWLERLRVGNRLAALLPLLATIAAGQSAQAEYGLLDGTVAVQVAPC